MLTFSGPDDLLRYQLVSRGSRTAAAEAPLWRAICQGEVDKEWSTIHFLLAQPYAPLSLTQQLYARWRWLNQDIEKAEQRYVEAYCDPNLDPARYDTIPFEPGPPLGTAQSFQFLVRVSPRRAVNRVASGSDISCHLSR